MTKYAPDGELVYSHDFTSDPDWIAFDANSMQGHHFVIWSGDFYTLHATDDGAVLTKYTLNLDPICSLFILTLMPYHGSSPASIEFDASASYDPDPGDTLTYAWDFDGDHVYGETVDDAYTGDPDMPTHDYTQSYTGPVYVKVTDPHGAESICTVTVVVIIT